MIDFNTGNVGIGTTAPATSLDVAGIIRSSSGGFRFPDGTTQTTATLKGDKGANGANGATGPKGDPGPPTQSSAVCVDGTDTTRGVCSCSHLTVSNVSGPCTVTSQTGSCSAAGPVFPIGGGSCCVCGL